MSERLTALDNRVEELIALRDELRTLVRDWDQRLAHTPDGQRARLLDMMAGRPALDRPPVPDGRVPRRARR